MKKPHFNNYQSGDTSTAGNDRPQSNQTEESIQDAMNRYSSLSYDELMSEMLAQAARSRAAGTLDNATLEDFYAKAAPGMNETQRSNLRALIDRLKV